MADEKKNVPATKAEKKSKKSDAKRENFFVRIWNKFVKLCKDTVGELKKVVWTSKSEVIKSFVLVISTVLGVSLIIAIIDLSAFGVLELISKIVG